jgi:hypothetical protein
MVTRRGRTTADLVLSDEERSALLDWSALGTSQRLGLRSRIILACAEGRTNLDVAKSLKLDRMTVGRWRTRFATQRIAGLVDQQRPRRSLPATPDEVEAVLVTTLTMSPRGAASWSQRSMAAHSGLSPSTIGRIWREFGLAPHDPGVLPGLPEHSMGDVVGVYLEPPHRTVAIAFRPARGRVDWSRIVHSRPEPRADERRLLTELLGALNIAQALHSGPLARGAVFGEFLEATLSGVPSCDVHVVSDGISVEAARAITARPVHPHLHTHVVPSGSWTTVVGPWLAPIAKALTHDGALRSWAEKAVAEPSTYLWTLRPRGVREPQAEAIPDLRAR